MPLFLSLACLALLPALHAAPISPGSELGLQTWTCRNMTFEQVVAFATKHGITVSTSVDGRIVAVDTEIGKGHSN